MGDGRGGDSEAAYRVITVHSVPASYWTGKPVPLPGDEEKVTKIRTAPEDAVATAAKLGPSQPESVTVTAVIGFPAQALIDASRANTAALMARAFPGP